jgi:hypothetical protein
MPVDAPVMRAAPCALVVLMFVSLLWAVVDCRGAT